MALQRVHKTNNLIHCVVHAKQGTIWNAYNYAQTGNLKNKLLKFADPIGTEWMCVALKAHVVFKAINLKAPCVKARVMY